jgi:creatinine amidohydrolase
LEREEDFVHISDMNWHQVADYLTRDDRAVLPLGSTEQHAYLSLSVDSILSERVAVEAAAPLHVPVFPVVPYGITPYFRAYPGTLTLRVATYLAVVRDLLDGLAEHGFKRIVLVNGHGGNAPAQGLADEWMAEHPGCQVRFYNWWNAPGTWAAVQAIDPVASHASWMENFPWTRLADVALPSEQKPMTDLIRLKLLGPHGVRQLLGDGNFGGLYQRPDADMQTIWDTAVAETRAALEGPWQE